MRGGGRDGVFDGLLAELRRASKPMLIIFGHVHRANEVTLDLLVFSGRVQPGEPSCISLVVGSSVLVDRAAVGPAPYQSMRSTCG